MNLCGSGQTTLYFYMHVSSYLGCSFDILQFCSCFLEINFIESSLSLSISTEPNPKLLCSLLADIYVEIPIGSIFTYFILVDRVEIVLLSSLRSIY